MSSDNAPAVGPLETLSLLGRSLGFVRPYLPQVFVKLMLSLIGVSVVLILPWPLKVLVDHVVMDMPIGTSPTLYPPYVQPLVHWLEGLSPGEIVAAVVAISVLGIVLIGAFRMGARDTAQGELAEGLDTATRSENQANTSGSSVSGLVGLFEYRYQLRITHRINHDLRTIRSADRIVFVEDSRIIETGTHDELMANPAGAYRRFVDLQVGSSV